MSFEHYLKHAASKRKRKASPAPVAEDKPVSPSRTLKLPKPSTPTGNSSK